MFGSSARIRRVVVSAVGVTVMAVLAVAVPASAQAKPTSGTATVQHAAVTSGPPTRHTDFWDW